MPTRGLEPPHLAAIDPKSIASASSATSAFLGAFPDFAIIAKLTQLRKLSPHSTTVGTDTYPRFCSVTSCPITVPSSVSTSLHQLAVHGLLGVTQPRLHRCDGIKWCCHYLTHPPCSQLHARLAGTIAGPAGRLLPYRFTPYPSCLGRESFLLRL